MFRLRLLQFSVKGETSENDGTSWGDLWDDPCGVSDWVSGVGTSGPVVLVVTDVLVSPSSVVTEVCGGFSLGADGDSAEPQSFSFSQKKRARSWTATQEEMRYESSSARTPPP